MDDYNEDFFDDDNQASFKLERNAFERLGYEDLLGMGGAINLKKSGYSDIDKFKLITLATIILINDIFDGNVDLASGNNYTFDDSEIKYVLSLVETIPDFKYKNPSAFVLGYMPVFKRFGDKSVRNKRSINKNILEDTFKIYDKIEIGLSTKLEKVDIVRYARLCLSL
jgi:hypothetical protein